MLYFAEWGPVGRLRANKVIKARHVFWISSAHTVKAIIFYLVLKIAVDIRVKNLAAKAEK